MSNKFDPQTNPDQPAIYQIRIKGYLGCQWAGWFEGLTMTLDDDGNTVLTGLIVDQPALFGLLKKVRDIGATLLSINRLEFDQTDMPDNK
jgi:hypothetical protein